MSAGRLSRGALEAAWDAWNEDGLMARDEARPVASAASQAFYFFYQHLEPPRYLAFSPASLAQRECRVARGKAGRGPVIPECRASALSEKRGARTLGRKGARV